MISSNVANSTPSIEYFPVKVYIIRICMCTFIMIQYLYKIRQLERELEFQKLKYNGANEEVVLII